MTDTDTSARDLERLAALRDQGALTAEEFEVQKQRILGTPPTGRPIDDLDGDGIGDFWVFALLLVPLLAAFLVAAASGSGSSTMVRGPFLFLNLLFMLYDHGRLKAVGRRLPVWQLVLGFLLVPIYLFFRARRLGSGYGYIVWYFVALLAPLLAAFPAVQN